MSKVYAWSKTRNILYISCFVNMLGRRKTNQMYVDNFDIVHIQINDIVKEVDQK